MDINDLRSAVTLLLLLMFLAIVAWVYSKKRDQHTFDEIAALPLQGEDGSTE
jgi:cytochrome c oxidase cbb3-type subunit IV